MSTVGIFPGEPVTPQTSDTPTASPRSASEKQSPADQFDSVLAEKQKPSARVDEPQQVSAPGEAAPVSDDPKASQQTDPPAEDTKNDDATTNLALAYLLATLPEQKLPPEKIAVAQTATPSSGEVLPHQSIADGSRTSTEPQTSELRWLANALQEPLAAKPVATATPLNPTLAMVSKPALTTVGKPEPEATTTEAKAALESTVDGPPSVPQALRVRLAATPAASPSAGVQDTSVAQPPAAVPKPGGMSIALQHSIMQSTQNQQTNPEMISRQVVTSSLVAEPPKNFAATTSDGNSKGDPNSDNPFDGRQILAGSTTQSPSIELTSLRPASENFASALEKTQHLQGVINHVVEAAERMRSDGRTNVELQVPLNDGKNLTIQLHLSNGELSPVFKTDSAELRDAIQQSWSQFTSSTSERGMRITTPVFESPQSGMGDLNQRQNREQQQQAQARQSESFQLPTQSKPGTRSASLPRIPNPTQQPIGGMAVYA